MALSANTDDIGRFVRTLFQNATPGTYVNLRILADDQSNSVVEPRRWKSVPIPPDDDWTALVAAAEDLANLAANTEKKAVFAPPVATFHRPNDATEPNLANGLAVLIECDKHPQHALEILENLLGPATLVIASGGIWNNPTSGGIEERLHAYWVLTRATSSAEEHDRLKDVRLRAAKYIDSDSSAVPLNHPLRWPGSWHRKGEPRLSRIVKVSNHLVDLDEAFSLLRSVSASNSSPDDLQIEADIENIRAALDAIPNTDDTDWEFWNKVGMATFRASGGSRPGGEAWLVWSSKSPKHNDGVARDRYRHFRSSPPTEIGVGWLYKQAKINNPKWKPVSDSTPPGAYQRGTSGAIIPNKYNIAIALRKFNVRFTFNTFTHRMLLNGEPISDAALNALWFRLEEEEFFQPRLEYFFNACEVIAHENPFHPVKDYLESLQWDGEPRIDSWLIDYAEAQLTTEPNNRPYVEAISRLILLAGVARIYDPGCKFDEILILISPKQGTNKSSALRVLAHNEDWFTDSLSLSAKEKEVLEQIQGKWIVETSELSGMSNNDVETLKAFLGRQNDRARMSYERFVTEMPRSCIFFGTTNSVSFLRDDQNRRFWPQQIKEFDLDGLRAVHNQLWAEAVHYYKRGESIRLAKELHALAEHEQDRHRQVDGMEARLAHYFGDNEIGEPLIKGRVLTIDVFKVVAARNRQDETRVGAAMRRLGWQHKRSSMHGAKLYVYFRGDPVDYDRDIYVYPKPGTLPNALVTEWYVTHDKAPGFTSHSSYNFSYGGPEDDEPY